MTMLERVSEAIAAVQVFSRFNDWTSDSVPGLPIEVCRYGADDEPEIVVIKRFPAGFGEERALEEVVSAERARAAITALMEQIRPVMDDQWTGPREAVAEVEEAYVRGFNAACASHRAGGGMSGVIVGVSLAALLCIDGWLKKAIAAYDRRTAALAKPDTGE